MAAIETVRSRPQDALRAPGRPVTADPVALLRPRLAFPREVFDVLVEPVIRGLAGCVPSERDGDAAADTQPLGRSLRLALRALAIRRDRILPPNAPPERVGELAHRWTYAVLLAAMLRKAAAPGSGAPDSRYECIVPELGRIWIGQDCEASAALAEVLSDRCGQDNPILAILMEALSGRSDASAPVDSARWHQHPSDIDPIRLARETHHSLESDVTLSINLHLTTPPQFKRLSDIANQIVADLTARNPRLHVDVEISPTATKHTTPGPLAHLGALAFAIAVARRAFRRHRY
jgi:hypothetical protein